MLSFMRRRSDAKKTFASTTDLHSTSNGHMQPFNNRTISNTSQQSNDADGKGKPSFLASFRNQFSFGGDRRGSCNDVNEKQNVSYNSTSIQANSKTPAATPFNVKNVASKSKKSRSYANDDRFSGHDVSMDSGMPDSPHAGFETSDTISSHSESPLDTLDSDTIGPSSACTSATCSPILSVRSISHRPHSPSTATVTSSDDTITPTSQSRKTKPRKAPAARSARFAYNFDQSSLERSFDDESMLSGDFYRGSSMRSSVSESYLSMQPVAPPRRHKKSQDETNRSKMKSFDGDSMSSMSPLSAKRAMFAKSASEASSCQTISLLNGTRGENESFEEKSNCSIGFNQNISTFGTDSISTSSNTRLKYDSDDSDTPKAINNKDSLSERKLKNRSDENGEISFSSQGVDGESLLSIFDKLAAKIFPDSDKSKSCTNTETENESNLYQTGSSKPQERTYQNGYAKRSDLLNLKADLHLNAELNNGDLTSLERITPLTNGDVNCTNIYESDRFVNGQTFNGLVLNDRQMDSIIPVVKSCSDSAVTNGYGCDRNKSPSDCSNAKGRTCDISNYSVKDVSVMALGVPSNNNSRESVKYDNGNIYSSSKSLDIEGIDMSRNSLIISNGDENIDSNETNDCRRISADEHVNSAILHALHSSNSDLTSKEADEENYGTIQRELKHKMKQGRKISPLEELYLKVISSGSNLDLFTTDSENDRQLDDDVVGLSDVDSTSSYVNKDESPNDKNKVFVKEVLDTSLPFLQSITAELEENCSTTQPSDLKSVELTQSERLSTVLELESTTSPLTRESVHTSYSNEGVLDTRDNNVAALEDPLNAAGPYVHIPTQSEQMECRQVKNGFISPLKLFDKSSSGFEEFEPDMKTEVKIMCKVGSERPRRSSIPVNRRDSPVDVIKQAVDQFRLNETSPELYCLFVIDKHNKGLTRVADSDIVADMSAESLLLCKKEHLANSCEDTLYTPRSCLSVSQEFSSTSFLFNPVSPRSTNLLNERILRLESELNDRQRMYERRLRETEESLLRYRSIASQSVDQSSRVKVLEETLVKIQNEFSKQEELVKKAEDQLNSCRESGNSAEAVREYERKLAASQSALQRIIRDQLCIGGWLEETKSLQAKTNSNSDVSRSTLYDIASTSPRWELKTICIPKTTKCLNSVVSSKENSSHHPGSDNNGISLRKDDRILEVNGHATYNMQPTEFESRLNTVNGDWKIVVLRRCSNNNH